MYKIICLQIYEWLILETTKQRCSYYYWKYNFAVNGSYENLKFLKEMSYW